MPMPTVRHMMKGDLAMAVEIERLANLVTFEVPGVGPGPCEALPPWGWTERDFLDAISQYRSKKQLMHDTRTKVATVTERLRDEATSEETDVELVVGSLVYEIREKGFEILKLSAVPCDEEVRRALLDDVMATCGKSTKRRSLSCHISDGDWETLRFFVRIGWDRKLIPGHFEDGRDAWHVSTDVPANVEAAAV